MPAITTKIEAEASPYTYTTAFGLRADGVEIEAKVMHETETGRLVSIYLTDKRTDQMVSIPPYAFDALVEAVIAKREW